MGPTTSKPSDESSPSAMTPPAKRPNSVIYDYERDTPDRLRPHKRHRQIVGENQQVTREIAEPCPCQADAEELEKQFWSHIHRSQPQRDADIERRLRETRLARKAEAKKANKPTERRLAREAVVKKADKPTEPRLTRETEAKKADKPSEPPREAEAKKAEKLTEPPWKDDDPYEYLFVAEEKRQQRLLEAREFETPEERVERERQEREDEGRTQLAYKFKEFLFPPGSFFG